MENFPYIGLISWIIFHIYQYPVGKDGKIVVEVSMLLAYFIDVMENKAKFRPDPGIELMDQVRQVLRYHHYAYRTEQAYCDWIVRYIKFFGSKKHPRHMGKTEIDAYLTHLAADRKVSASTQRQTLDGTIFLYR